MPLCTIISIRNTSKSSTDSCTERAPLNYRLWSGTCKFNRRYMYWHKPPLPSPQNHRQLESIDQRSCADASQVWLPASKKPRSVIEDEEEINTENRERSRFVWISPEWVSAKQTQMWCKSQYQHPSLLLWHRLLHSWDDPCLEKCNGRSNDHSPRLPLIIQHGKWPPVSSRSMCFLNVFEAFRTNLKQDMAILRRNLPQVLYMNQNTKIKWRWQHTPFSWLLSGWKEYLLPLTSRPENSTAFQP